MTRLETSCPPQLAGVIPLRTSLRRWLLEAALPLWDEEGTDRITGGFFETLQMSGRERAVIASGDVRRGRVVARQIYVFDLGVRLGWRSRFSDPVEHGLKYLFSHLHPGDGLLHTAVDAGTREPCAPFSLYEQAFYLFALARAQPLHGDRYPIAGTATRCLERLRAGWGRPAGGFEESNPPVLPLKSNPHMHLLEASLAWLGVTEGAERRPWYDLAHELVGLCLTRFRDASSGAIRENFDSEWRPAPGEAGRIVEPGHLFEWAWLLLQWCAVPGVDESDRRSAALAARQLAAVAERCGVDAERGVAINEMWDDLTAKDTDAKLWPQTERVRAWCALLEAAQTSGETADACRQLRAAATAMAAYLRADAPGLWHEVNGAVGGFQSGPSRASSLYHLAGAIAALDATVGLRMHGDGSSGTPGVFHVGSIAGGEGQR